MSLNLFQLLPSLSLSFSWWPFLFSFSLPSLCLLSLLPLVFPLFLSCLKLAWSLPFHHSTSVLFVFHSHLVLKYPSSCFAPLTCYESPYHSPTFLPQLPGEAASLQAHVWCCPMCTAEGTDPRSGGGVQGTGGGHGVRTQGSRDGHRRGMDRHNKSRGYDLYTPLIWDDSPTTTSFIIYCCHHFLYVLQLLAFISLLCISPSNSVPAPVQESSLELFHHPTWNQYIWQSHEPRCIHYWTSWRPVHPYTEQFSNTL